ncbi:hypothetical protein B0H13DRAFT_1979720 [Mycena leptocephala]|nr:hypothetical protein B0H13DRAFT_1979720 [Mycena leptocephala]
MAPTYLESTQEPISSSQSTMKFTSGAVFFSLLAHVHLALSGNCRSGIGEDECVAYYQGNNCNGDVELGSYVPTCEGNCFQYSSFDSLQLSGTTHGVDCEVYSDSNCQNLILDTGNVGGDRSQCFNTKGAQSMRCYYDC